jgi:outer membrane protein, heavy metal efflux system
MNGMLTSLKHAAALLMVAVSAAGCTMHPRGEADERKLARDAGIAYTRPFEKRVLPDLKSDAEPEELVRYALLANGDVEAKYWQWRAALEQVPMEGTQKAGVELSLETMIMSGQSALANTTIGIANDAMNALQVPTKLSTAAQKALHEAQAAGRRFDMARWELRNKVLTAYYDYALTAEQARLEDANTRLLEMMAQVSASRVATGMASQTDLLKAENETAMSRNTAAGFRGKLPGERAALNGLLSRVADAPLKVPAALPAARELQARDTDLLAAAARNNPELQALAHDAAANQDAIRRARLEYLPDFNLGFSTDLAGITQTLMGSVVLPYLRHEAIDAGIRQAEADLRQSQAMQRQSSRNVAARILGDLAMLHEAQRQVEVLEKDLIPRAQQITDASQTSYGSGNGTMIDLLDSQRSILVLRRMAAEMRTERERQIADLEEVCGGLPRREPQEN